LLICLHTLLQGLKTCKTRVAGSRPTSSNQQELGRFLRGAAVHSGRQQQQQPCQAYGAAVLLAALLANPQARHICGLPLLSQSQHRSTGLEAQAAAVLLHLPLVLLLQQQALQVPAAAGWALLLHRWQRQQRCQVMQRCGSAGLQQAQAHCGQAVHASLLHLQLQQRQMLR
jgi:hypothetical protein